MSSIHRKLMLVSRKFGSWVVAYTGRVAAELDPHWVVAYTRWVAAELDPRCFNARVWWNTQRYVKAAIKSNPRTEEHARLLDSWKPSEILPVVCRERWRTDSYYWYIQVDTILHYVFFFFLITWYFFPAQPAGAFTLDDLLDKPWSRQVSSLPAYTFTSIAYRFLSIHARRFSSIFLTHALVHSAT